MLTLKLISEQTEKVIKGLEKKHFSGAAEAINNVLATDKKRREAQTQLDQCLAESKKLAAQIGGLMKEGKKDEAEAIKAEVARIKENTKTLQDNMDEAQRQLNEMLCAIPNIPYDIVPEGTGAEDNLVVKTGGLETELPKDALPHWELAKKYNLIDFDLGVKITGAGFPVYRGKGARLQRALINFFLDEARKSGYEEIRLPKFLSLTSIVMSFSMKRICLSRIVHIQNASVAKPDLMAKMYAD